MHLKYVHVMTNATLALWSLKLLLLLYAQSHVRLNRVHPPLDATRTSGMLLLLNV